MTFLYIQKSILNLIIIISKIWTDILLILQTISKNIEGCHLSITEISNIEG